MNEYLKSCKASLIGFVSLLILVFLLAFTALARAAESETLNFGIISTESSQSLRKIWEPFIEDMKKQTGLNIKAFFATDYAGIIEGMRFNKVQLAWYGNKAAMEAVDRAQGQVFMQTVNYDGSDGYYSHLIAHKDSPLTSIEDMFEDSENLIFANGDPNSTSGFLVPSYYVFAVNKVDPKTAFKRSLNSNHEANALSVANRQVDVATCNSEALERLSITFPDKRKEVKVIWTSPLIPSDPLVWREDLDPAVKRKIEAFLLGYGQAGPEQERQLQVLKALQWKGFQKSTDKQLNPIRQLELFKEKSKLESSGEINEARQERLAEIEKKLAELEAD